ncbi:unnamed protein product [Aureobasidium mustum]|uniref:Uncharacterized protein n=1 Tax=Aureobasidium mustum TaxID=2773714 RepID=A0A9N8JJA9_9PEZI|nr:unnamed protein product [Aureobasidium mustum]
MVFIRSMLEMDSVLDMLWALDQRWTQQRRHTAHELEKLSEYVHFEWGDTKNLDSVSARVLTIDKPGLRGGKTTCACRVGLDNELRYIIADGSALLADLYNPRAQNMSSFLLSARIAYLK